MSRAASTHSDADTSLPGDAEEPAAEQAEAELDPQDQLRLEAMAKRLRARDLPPEFIQASLRTTAAVLRRLAPAPGDPRQRKDVREFIAANQVAGPRPPEMRPEFRQVEAERLHSRTLELLGDARTARGRHEIRKTRSKLRRVDHKRLVRLLGGEGVELARLINACLRGG